MPEQHNRQRVFITGMGTANACGMTVDETWQTILTGQSGIAPIQQWDIATWPHCLGGEVKDYTVATRALDRKLLKLIARQDVLGIYAVQQAIEQSGWLPYRETLLDQKPFNDQTGLFVGSPGNKYYQQYDFLPLIAQAGADMQAFAAKLTETVHPMWLLRILPNNVLAYTGIQYGFKGMNHNVTNHAIGGIQALIEAYHAIARGQIKRAVVVAYDNGTEPQALFYYERLGVLSAQHLRPFDHSHDGTILAEGAAAIVLESEEAVLARQGKGLGEMVGGLSATEATGLFTLDVEGKKLSALMTKVLTQQAISHEQIGLVVTHGNGNIRSDLSEAAAMNHVFSHQQPMSTAFKWAMGHTLAASGLLDVILSVYSINQLKIPGIANLETLAPECQHLNIKAETREWMQGTPYALVLNRGFASMNAGVVIKVCS